MARTQANTEELEPPPEQERVEKPAGSTEEQDSRELKVHPLGFFEQISRFSTADWEQHIVYLYRLAPITDRLAGGTTKYLQKYGSRFDQDTVKAEHGSGRYRLQLNRMGDKGASKTVRTYELDIEDTNFPPRVPPGEWLDDPRNKRWAWAKKKEDAANTVGGDPWTPERITRMVKELRPDVPPSDQMSITKAVLDAVKETRAELGAASNPAGTISMLKDLILITKPAEGPKTPAADPLEILKLARDLFAPPAKPAEDPMMKLLMSQLENAQKDASAERQRNHELQLKMLEARANQSDPLEMVQKVLTLQEKLGGGENRNWKEKLVDEGMQHVPELLSLGKQALTRYQTRPATTQQQQQRTQQPQPSTSAQPTTDNAPQQSPQAQPGADTTVPDTQSPADPEIAFLLPIMMQHGHNFVTAFKNDPVNGGPSLADSLILFGGLGTYERIARMGQAKIIETIKLTGPDGAMYKDLLAVGTEAMLADFIEGFIAGPEDDEDDADEQPVTVQRTPRKKKEQTA